MVSSSNGPQELADQGFVVTGSSSGIGRAIARELAAAGARVVLHARANREGAEAAAAEITAAGGQVAGVLLADLSELTNCRRFFEESLARLEGRLDGWVNNAGADILTGSGAQKSFEDKLQALWSVDVAATIHLSRYVGQYLHRQDRRGVILNLGWDLAAVGFPGDSGELFGTVKSAVAGFTRSLALSLAPHVRVNCVAPGWIQTAWGQNASEYWQRLVHQSTPLRRWGTPHDVAAVARFLCGPSADFITGQVIPVNGGAIGFVGPIGNSDGPS